MPRPSVAQPTPLPAPFGGMNTREGIAALKPQEARGAGLDRLHIPHEDRIARLETNACCREVIHVKIQNSCRSFRRLSRPADRRT